MHIGHLASITMTQQDQEGGITRIAFLSNIVKTMINVECFTNIIRERATSGPGVRAHGPQSQFRSERLMRLCGKLLDIWLAPSGVVASQMLLSQQISCISLAVGIEVTPAYHGALLPPPVCTAGMDRLRHRGGRLPARGSD